MTLSTTPYFKPHLALGVLAVAAAFILLSPGPAWAQQPDFEAVGARLIEAVKAGELSPEQAAAMMGELARARFAQRLGEALGKKGGTAAAKTMEVRFLENGVSPDTFRWIVKNLEHRNIGGGAQERVLGLMLRLVTAAKDGPVALDKEKVDRIRGDLGLSQEQIGLVFELLNRLSKGLRLRDQIHAALKAGKISPEQAKEKILAVRKEMYGDKKTQKKGGAKDEASKRHEAFARRIQEAVKAGKMSKAEARKALEAYKKRQAPQGKGRDAREKGSPDPKQLEAVKKKIWEAVKAGRITEDQAKRHWEDYLKSLREKDAKRRR